MKKHTFIAIPLVAFMMLACGLIKDDFMREYDQVTDEAIAIIDADPTAQGADKAMDFVIDKTIGLQEKMDAGVEANPEVRDAYLRQMTTTSLKFSKLEKRHPEIEKEIDRVLTKLLLINRR